MQPVPEEFSNDRVILRRARPDDAAAIFVITSHPEVTKFMDWPTPRDSSEVRRQLEKTTGRWGECAEFQWVIEDRSGSNIIGKISAKYDDHSVEFGYFIGREFWGRGLATTAINLLLDWLKNQPDISRICATTDAENTRSRRMLERLGLSYECTHPMATYRPNIGGLQRDTVLYTWYRDRP